MYNDHLENKTNHNYGSLPKASCELTETGQINFSFTLTGTLTGTFTDTLSIKEAPLKLSKLSHSTQFCLINVIEKLDELENSTDTLILATLLPDLLNKNTRKDVRNKLKSQLSQAIETQSEQKKALKNSLLDKIDIHYHQEAGRFIHSIKDIGKLGLAAMSTFSNEADDQLTELIDKEILLASDKRIEKWQKKVNIKDKKAHEEQQLKYIQERSCLGSIGMYTHSQLKNRLDELATQGSISTNKLAQQHVTNALENYKTLREHTSDSDLNAMLLDFVKSSKLASKNEEETSQKQKWVLRIPTSIHAAIIFYAQEINLKPAYFAKYLLYRSI